MIPSALAVGCHRLMASEALLSKLGHDAAGKPSVFPVQIPAKATVPAITVNRVFERDDPEAGHVVGLFFTVLARSVEEIESIGQLMIDEIDGTDDFEFEDLIGITFDKEGADITGRDGEMALLYRQIEFCISW